MTQLFPSLSIAKQWQEELLVLCYWSNVKNKKKAAFAIQGKNKKNCINKLF